MCVCPALVTSSGSLMTWILSHPWDYGVEPREDFQGPWICGDNRGKVKCTALLSAHMRGLLDQRHRLETPWVGFQTQAFLLDDCPHVPECLPTPHLRSLAQLHPCPNEFLGASKSVLAKGGAGSEKAPPALFLALGLGFTPA